MLSAATLIAATARVVSVLSPTKCGRVRIPCNASNTIFRYDPYACRVLASPVKMTPVKSQIAIPDTVPMANRSLLDILNREAPAASLSMPTVALTTSTPAPSSSTTRYAYIKFKHDALCYVAPFRVAVGDWVMVEGDRGEDLGRVEEISTEKPSYPVPHKITRKANQADSKALMAKRAKEEQAVRSAQTLADSLSLPIQIADCEFQYDYGKLTVFFRSKSRHVDFRKLQRGLFREFRCRIWLTEAFKHIENESA